jgi:tetratricopeptide (TPR) repeat protein
LADTYALLGDWQYAVMTFKEALPRAKAAAVKALELDSSMSEAHTSLGYSLRAFDWNFDAAGKEFQRAIELNPSYATAHHWNAVNLGLLGRPKEALVEMRKAENLDPLSLIINSDLAELLLLTHSYDESVIQSRKIIEMDPAFAIGHKQLGDAYLLKRMDKEAVAELQKAVRLSGGSPICVAELARAYVAAGKINEAVKLLSDLEKSSNASFTNAPQIALIYASMGDNEQAMNWLERAYEERFNPSILLRSGFRPSVRIRALKTFCAVSASLLGAENLMMRANKNRCTCCALFRSRRETRATMNFAPRAAVFNALLKAVLRMRMAIMIDSLSKGELAREKSAHRRFRFQRQSRRAALLGIRSGHRLRRTRTPSCPCNALPIC